MWFCTGLILRYISVGGSPNHATMPFRYRRGLPHTVATIRLFSLRSPGDPMSRTLLAALLVLSLSLAGALAPAAQAATSCTGDIRNTTIQGDLVVVPRATCVIDNVTVTGNVQ